MLLRLLKFRKTSGRIFLSLPGIFKTVDDALGSECTDFEDALQYFAAEHPKQECIVSCNKRDFSPGTIPTFIPEELLRAIK